MLTIEGVDQFIPQAEQLIDVLNRLVGDETGFTKTRGFF